MSLLHSRPSDDGCALHWHAAYVCVRHEKRIADQLARRNIEHYLPLYRKQHWRKQRRWTAELPLFPGYVFVRISVQEKLRVLEIPNVVHLLGVAGKPAVLSNEEIQTMRSALGARKAEPHPYLCVGKRVRIISGALAGVEGVITRRKRQPRIVVSIAAINQSMALELDAADLQLLSEGGAERAALAA